jgi:hypothetical protein
MTFIKTSETKYVTIKIPHPLLGHTIVAVVPTGKTRTTEDGTVEAEGICLTPNSNLRDVWFSRKDVG